MIVLKYFLWFMFYSFVGWFWEVCLCLTRDKRFINRGFFNGPYCPIYGAGAVLDILLLGRIENPGLLFVLGVLVTGILEYATSYVLEKLFHARWWDYSDRKFNINGRICLIGMIVFGLMSLVLIKLVHPFVMHMTAKIPDPILYTLGSVIFAGFVFDICYTIIHIKGFDKKLAEISAGIQMNLQENLEKARSIGVLEKAKQDFEESELKARLEEVISSFRNNRMNRQEHRMLRAFPKWKSVRYNDIVERIRNKK